MSEWYKLDEDYNPVPCDMLEGASMFSNPNRIVGRTKLTGADDVLISTVFLGLDHSFGGEVPILFETMIFGGKHDLFQDKYCTYGEAVKGHQAAVRQCMKDCENIVEITDDVEIPVTRKFKKAF